MSQSTELNGTTCHSTNGKQSHVPNGPLSTLVGRLPGTFVTPESFIDAMGCAVASAAVGRSLQLQTAERLRVRAGFSLVVATQDPTHAATALNHIIAPLKCAQAKRHAALALLDPEMHQQRLNHLRSEYATFLDSNDMPDPDHVAHYTGQIAALQAALRPVMLVENPAPGRLTLAIEKSPNHCVLATMDDLALSSLLDNERTPRCRLDLELLNKSHNQQIFDGAFLERVVGSSRVDLQACKLEYSIVSPK